MGAYLPARLDLTILQGADLYVPFRLLLSDGSLLDTSTYTARMTVRGSDKSAITNLAMTSAATGIEVGYDPAKWAASTAYVVGQWVVPKAALNGYVYQVTVAGTTGSSEPTWPTTIGQTVTSGTATFKNMGTDANVTNLRINRAGSLLTAANGVTAWGIGFYDLELVDAYGHITRLVQGTAVLSEEQTY